MAVVVVAVVVFGGAPGGQCGLTTDCNSDTEIQRHEKEKQIHVESIREERWEVNKEMYVVPLEGFEGVRAEVTTNLGTFPAWFPIMDHCIIHSSRWWRMMLVVKKVTSSTATVTLRVHNCQLSCELTTDARHTSGSDLKLQKLELFGRGASRWRTQYPRRPCRVKITIEIFYTETLPFCTNPPPIGTASPPHSRPELQPTKWPTQQPEPTQQPTQQPAQQPTQQSANGTLTSISPPATPSNSTELRACLSRNRTPPLLWVAVVVVVVIVMVVMVVTVALLKKRRQDQREN